MFQKGDSLIFCSQGTSRGTSQDSRCPFVPGQKSFLVPLSLCPGTKKVFLSRCPFVPGQEQQQKSRDKLLCPGTSRGTKISPFLEKKKLKKKKWGHFLAIFWPFCPAGRPGTEDLVPGIFSAALVPGQRDSGTR